MNLIVCNVYLNKAVKIYIIWLVVEKYAWELHK